MARFLIDAQLPLALVDRLASIGHEAIHVFHTDMREADDRTIWDYASQNGFVVITKDADFVDFANLGPGPPVIWVRLGNMSNERLWARLGPVFPDIVYRITRGAALVEIR